MINRLTHEIPDTPAQVHYETVGTVTQPPPETFLSVQSPLTCSDSSQIVPNHAFVKLGTTLSIDAKATATAHCEVWYYNDYWWSNYRYFSYIDWSYRAPGASVIVYHFAGPWPPPATDPVEYDTRNPGTGTGTQTNIFSTEGKHSLVFYGVIATTNCNFPGLSDEAPREVNAVKCRPKFWDRHLAPNASPVIVYLPTDSYWDDAWTVLQDAVDSWNDQMPSNAQYVAERGTCDGGAGCVQVGEEIQDFCGWSDADRDGNQVITGNAIIDLKENWNTWNDDSLRRTFAHELGHHRGMDDYDDHNAPSGPQCPINDAVMQNKFSCGSTSTPMDDVTPTDSLPASSSVYGGNTKTYCGF